MPDLKITTATERRVEHDRRGKEVILFGRTAGRLCRDCQYLDSSRSLDVSASVRRCRHNANYAKMSWQELTPACMFFKAKEEVR